MGYITPMTRFEEGDTNPRCRMPNTFCALLNKGHAVRRKRISAAYTKSALFASSTLAAIKNDIIQSRLLPILYERALTGKSIDLVQLSHALCIDFVTAAIFGGANGSDFLHDPENLRHWLEHFEWRYCKESFWDQEMPRLTRGLRYLGFDMLPKEHYRARAYLEKWVKDLCCKADHEGHVNEQKSGYEAIKEPTIYQQIKAAIDIDLKDAHPETKKLEIASECLDHICKYYHHV